MPVHRLPPVPSPARQPLVLDLTEDGVDRSAWHWRAACQGIDSSIFFPPDRAERDEERVGREGIAKSICAECSVRPECLDHALNVPEQFGIWGGLNEAERRALMHGAQTGDV